MNKKVLVDLLKEQDEAKSEVITTEQFFSTLEGIAAPLDSDIKVKLLAIYDKKGEGKINYADFLTEQKFVHAVSLVFYCVLCVEYGVEYCVREWGRRGRETYLCL